MGRNRKDDFDDSGIPRPDDEVLREEVAALKAQQEADRAELARLQEQTAELTRLRAELADAKVALTAPGLNVTGAGSGANYWEVNLRNGPTHVVRAADPANAWDVYRREMGVIGSQETPTVGPADAEKYHAAQAKRHGKKPSDFILAE